MSNPEGATENLKVDSITSIALRIPRNFGEAVGGAGSPSPLTDGSRRYRQAAGYATVYSQDIECLLVKVTADGLVGWGEAQTPIAPEVCHSILQYLAGPLLIGQNATDPDGVHQSLYNAMRVRGHFTGFYLDALAAINIALWDIAGQVAGKPVYQLLAGEKARNQIPLYISGLPGSTLEQQLQFAVERASEGTAAFKVFWTGSFDDCLQLVRSLRDRLPKETELYVDALWRMDESDATRNSDLLLAEHVGWLEAPFMPEEISAHSRLRRSTTLPIAIGESYRSSHQFLNIIEAGAASILQPDLGRCGISEAWQVANWGAANKLGFAPHTSISLGPQLAAAIHVAAVAPSLIRAEINPQILSIAQMTMVSPLRLTPKYFELPTLPGLGAQVAEEIITPYIIAHATVN